MSWFRTILLATLSVTAVSLPLTQVGAQTRVDTRMDRTSGPRVDTRSSGATRESLFDVQTARRLAKQDNMSSRFGPKAGNFRYDARMLRAAKIAESRARKHSQRRCWRYVKTALLEADVIESYPKTAYAKQAGDELTRQHGFRQLPIRDPFKAPVGSVLVYGGRGPGHVEIRTADGFVSDFESPKPSKRPLIGVYVKPDERSKRRDYSGSYNNNSSTRDSNSSRNFDGRVYHRPATRR